MAPRKRRTRSGRASSGNPLLGLLVFGVGLWIWYNWDQSSIDSARDGAETAIATGAAMLMRYVLLPLAALLLLYMAYLQGEGSLEGTLRYAMNAVIFTGAAAALWFGGLELLALNGGGNLPFWLRAALGYVVIIFVVLLLLAQLGKVFGPFGWAWDLLRIGRNRLRQKISNALMPLLQVGVEHRISERVWGAAVPHLFLHCQALFLVLAARLKWSEEKRKALASEILEGLLLRARLKKEAVSYSRGTDAENAHGVAMAAYFVQSYHGRRGRLTFNDRTSSDIKVLEKQVATWLDGQPKGARSPTYGKAMRMVLWDHYLMRPIEK